MTLFQSLWLVSHFYYQICLLDDRFLRDWSPWSSSEASSSRWARELEGAWARSVSKASQSSESSEEVISERVPTPSACLFHSKSSYLWIVLTHSTSSKERVIIHEISKWVVSSKELFENIVGSFKWKVASELTPSESSASKRAKPWLETMSEAGEHWIKISWTGTRSSAP